MRSKFQLTLKRLEAFGIGIAGNLAVGEIQLQNLAPLIFENLVTPNTWPLLCDRGRRCIQLLEVWWKSSNRPYIIVPYYVSCGLCAIFGCFYFKISLLIFIRK